MTWRVVNTDNFGGDYPDESFVFGEFATEVDAQITADSLNAQVDALYSPRYFKVVQMPYELQPGFEP